MCLAWAGASATERFLHAFTFHGKISLTTAGDQHLGQARPVRSPQLDGEAVKGSSTFVEQPHGWTTSTKAQSMVGTKSAVGLRVDIESPAHPPDPDARGPLAEVANPRPEEPLAEYRLERERGDSCLSSGSRHPRVAMRYGHVGADRDAGMRARRGCRVWPAQAAKGWRGSHPMTKGGRGLRTGTISFTAGSDLSRISNGCPLGCWAATLSAAGRARRRPWPV